MIYCVVPEPLADELYPKLAGYYEDDPAVTVIVRQLSSGRDTTFGNVGEFAWRDTDNSHLLAMTISAEGKTGNGVQLFDPETTVLRVLDSTAAAYTGLAWRRDSADLAVFRAKTDDKHDGPAQVVLTWTGLGGSTERMRTYDASLDSSFPQDHRVVTYRSLSWSDDGGVLFLGIAKWDAKPAPPARGERGSATEAKPATTEDEAAGVDIWHWTDIAVQPRQKLSAEIGRAHV